MIADTPARAKICNTTQFNGKYGCLHCMHPNSGNNQSSYYFDKDIQDRSNEMYFDQVQKAEILAERYME